MNTNFKFQQGDIVSYTVKNSKGQVLNGTGIIVGVATNPSSLMDTIYMVEDPEVFPNGLYHYTTAPIHESSLTKIGYIESEYIYISQEDGQMTATSYRNYRNAKTRLLEDNNLSRITKVMNHNLYETRPVDNEPN